MLEMHLLACVSCGLQRQCSQSRRLWGLPDDRSSVYFAHFSDPAAPPTDVEKILDVLEAHVSGSPASGVFELPAIGDSEAHEALLSLLEHSIVDWGARIDENQKIWVYSDAPEILNRNRYLVSSRRSLSDEAHVEVLVSSEDSAPLPVEENEKKTRRVSTVSQWLQSPPSSIDPQATPGHRFWDAVRSDKQNELATDLLAGRREKPSINANPQPVSVTKPTAPPEPDMSARPGVAEPERAAQPRRFSRFVPALLICTVLVSLVLTFRVLDMVMAAQLQAGEAGVIISVLALVAISPATLLLGQRPNLHRPALIADAAHASERVDTATVSRVTDAVIEPGAPA